MKVNPKGIAANGLFPIFGNRKKFEVYCGNCGHAYQDKVVLQSECSSICPCCHAQNVWSLKKWHDAYEDNLKKEVGT